MNEKIEEKKEVVATGWKKETNKQFKEKHKPTMFWDSRNSGTYVRGKVKSK